MTIAGPQRGFARRLDVRGALAIAGAVACAVLITRSCGGWESIELMADDALVGMLRGEPSLDPNVVLVEIREADIRVHGQPLTDQLLARALRILVRHEPRAIGVDLYRDMPISPGNDDLREIVSTEPGIIMIEKRSEEDGDAVRAPAYVDGTGQVGFVDVQPDRDGRVRRGLLVMRGEDGGGVSFALRLALRFLAFDSVTPWSWVRDPDTGGSELHVRGTPLRRFRGADGPYASADDRGYQVPVDALRIREPGLRISLDDLLSGRYPAARLRDRIVLLGTAAASMRDEIDTPLGRVRGVDHHARLTSYVLALASREAPGLRWPSRGGVGIIVFGVALLGAAAGTNARRWWLIGALLAVGVGTVGGAALLLRARGIWLPVVPMQISFLAATSLGVLRASAAERKLRSALDDLFGRFVPRLVANELWRQRDDFRDGKRPPPRRAEVTILIADLAGYARAVAALQGEQLLSWSNEFLAAMAEITAAHGGVVDDFVGDQVMAVFGVPIPRETEAAVSHDARQAVACAFAMAERLESLRARWRAQGLPEPGMRIGACTGEVTISVVGSSDRLKYACVGDAVVVASRLESLGKTVGDAVPTPILVSERTRRVLDANVVAVDLGLHELRGLDRPMRVFRIDRPAPRREEIRHGS